MFKFTDVTATMPQAQLTSYNRSRTEYLTPSEILRYIRTSLRVLVSENITFISGGMAHKTQRRHVQAQGD